MMLLQLITWWYGPGWHNVAKATPRRLHKTAEAFSVRSLLQTIFSPWRRIVSYPGASLSDHFHAWLDNLVSRVIGFFVRFFVLLAAAITMAGVVVGTVVELIIWPCLPLVIIVALVMAVTGMGL